MGATQLQRIQVGPETVKGTAVTTGKVLTGIKGQIADMSELKTVQNDYQTGLMTGSDQGAPVFVSDVFEVALDGDFTPENGAYLLNAAWGSATPATTASVLTAAWTFAAPTTAINSPKTLTVQTGDNTEQLKGSYGLITDFEIKGAVNDVWKFTGKLQGRSVSAASTGFDSATALAATPLQTNMTKVFMDAASGTVGTTQLTATVREFSLKPKSGFHHKQFQDGVLYPTSDGQAKPEATLDLVLEYNSNAIGLRADWKNKAAKRVRVLNGASATATPAVYFDVAGYVSKFQPLGDKDGNSIVGVTLTCAPQGTTNLDFCNFKVINTLTGGL
jgi:cellulase/cellobiase CelA1